MNFATGVSSSAWESVPLPDAPGCVVWVWFRPPHAPEGLVIQIPEATRAACGSLTMFRLLAAAGIHPAAVAFWSFLGTTYEAHGGANPLLGGALPALPASGRTIFRRPCLPGQPVAEPAMICWRH